MIGEKCIFNKVYGEKLTCTALSKRYCASGMGCKFYKSSDEWKTVHWRDEKNQECMEVVRR